LADRTVSAIYINTVDQLTDILTKELGRVKFQEIRERLIKIIPCPDPVDRLVM
jgi:hypothetical protein